MANSPADVPDFAAEQRAAAGSFCAKHGFEGVNDAKKGMRGGQSYALHKAASIGDEKAVSALLAAGADPSAVNGNGLTPLQLAQQLDKGGHSAVRRALGERSQKAEIDELVKRGSDLATIEKHKVEAEEFCRTQGYRGVNVQKKALFGGGGFALHRAVTLGDEGAVTALLGARADPTVTNDKGLTPLELAQLIDKGGHTGVRRALGERSRRGEGQALANSKDVADAFCKAHGFSGVNDRKKALFGASSCPLHEAADMGDSDMVRALLDAKADPRLTNGKGLTALQVAQHADKGNHGKVRRALGEKPNGSTTK